MERGIFERWQSRLERGLVRLLERTYPEGQRTRLGDSLTRTRNLLRLNVPLARLFNSLGELSLGAGSQILSIVLLGRARALDPRDPVPVINLGRARLSLANRFLLRAPLSGAVAHNLGLGQKDLDSLIDKAHLPESKLVEVTLLRRRIEDRLELWRDLGRGELPASRVRKLLEEENKALQPLLSGKMPSLAELEKMEPQRVGFYYREYREKQNQLKKSRRGGRR